MQRIGFVCLLILIGCSSLAAQSANVEQQLMQLEHDWAAAYLRHDTATIARILAEDFVGIDGRGVVTNKAQELEEAKGTAAESAPSNFVVLDDQITDMKVRFYGSAAVVNGISVEKVRMAQGKVSTIRFRRTTVWVKRKGRWQCVSFHGSRILESLSASPQPQSTPERGK